MPGFTTNYAWRYPLPGEVANADSTQKLAYDMDATYTSLDTLRTQAIRRDNAAVTLKTGTVSVAKATRTKLTFDTVSYDSNGLVNLGTNNDRITIKTAGLYYVAATVQQSLTGISTPLSGVYVETAISKNGSTTPPSNDFILRHKQPENSSSQQTECWGFMLLSAADFLQLYASWGGSAVAGPLNASSFWLTAQLICRNP